MNLQKLHYENLGGTLVRREGLLSWRCPLCKAGGQSLEVMRTCPECGSKEATLPGAQAAPSEQDESVRKAWSRFSNELHRSPDAPYPGMSEAFEQHFSQSFTDRDWRVESGVWAAAWKAAKRHGAQPAPNAVAYLDLGVGGYVDIGTDLTDEELATLPKGRHMLGIVGTYGVEGYSPAQPAPSVPDGWKEAAIAWEVCASIHRAYGKGKDPFFNTRQGDFVKHANDARAMLAAPEAKP